jgi:putative NIF3 family GTP cyclohydrolase 1 type 2
MHTNFDVMGMADAAADELGLKDREVLDVTYEDDISKEGCGRVGSLKSCMSIEELAKLVKLKFNVPNVRVFGDLGDIVKIAAIIPGSGADFIDNAINAGADVIITGDISHHAGIDAVARGLGVIDAGHYGIEKLFIPYMEEFIKRELPNLKIYKAAIKEPFVVI